MVSWLKPFKVLRRDDVCGLTKSSFARIERDYSMKCEQSKQMTARIYAAINEQLKYWAGTYVPALFDQKIYTPKMSQENGEVIGADTVKKTGCFSANLDDHIRFAQQYIDLGFTCLIFHAAGPDQRGFIEAYGREVLPKVRSASKTLV